VSVLFGIHSHHLEQQTVQSGIQRFLLIGHIPHFAGAGVLFGDELSGDGGQVRRHRILLQSVCFGARVSSTTSSSHSIEPGRGPGVDSSL